MQFNSYVFILAFLPCFVLSYFLLNKIHYQAGKLAIIIAGFIFYWYGSAATLYILGISLLCNMLFSIVIQQYDRGRKLILYLSVAANIGLLLYFKYSNFAITIANDMFGKNTPLIKLALPLGISFFTFQQIMFLVAIYRKELKKVSIFDYFAYILYFPKLIMGPLAEPTDFMEQLNNPALKRFDVDNFASGIKLFSLGLLKKMLLADTFAKAVSWGFKNTGTASAGDLFLVMLFYTFEIYFDFSGYSDMAIGVSRMINIELPMNFNSPYKALSIRDFWKRWHMSLTSFLTRYVYFPLGGSRGGVVRTCVNIMLVFLISGFWHGANWTFILWGAIHGALQILERLFWKHIDKPQNAGARWVFSFFVVNILWLLFRSESISQWGELLAKMFSFRNMNISDDLLKVFFLPEKTFLFEKLGLMTLNKSWRLPMVLFIGVSFFVCLVPENSLERSKKLGVANMVLCAVAFIWSFLCLSAESVFVYFNF